MPKDNDHDEETPDERRIRYARDYGASELARLLVETEELYALKSAELRALKRQIIDASRPPHGMRRRK